MTPTNDTARDSANEPGEIEALLPWYATGTLNRRDAGRVEQALASDADLARQLKVIEDEHGAAISLNESLGAPSPRAMKALFEAIDAEPPRRASLMANPLARLGEFLGGFSSRTLAWSAVAGAFLLLAQAAVIGGVLINKRDANFQTASYQAASAGANALVSFKPDATVADVSGFLAQYRGSIISGPRSGMFKVRLGDRALSRQEAADLLARIQGEKVVSFAAVAD